MKLHFDRMIILGEIKKIWDQYTLLKRHQIDRTTTTITINSNKSYGVSRLPASWTSLIAQWEGNYTVLGIMETVRGAIHGIM